MFYTGFSARVRGLFMLLAVLLGGFIFVRSLLPVYHHFPSHGMDKVVHLAAYLALGLAALPAFAKHHPAKVWFGLAMFGGIIEILQGSMGLGRTADLADGLANISGAGLAVAAWIAVSIVAPKLWQKYK